MDTGTADAKNFHSRHFGRVKNLRREFGLWFSWSNGFMTGAEMLAMVPLIPWVNDGLPSRLRVLNEPNFTRPMPVTNSGWSSADFRPLMELVWPSDTGICKIVLGKRRNMRHARTATAQKNAGAQIIGQSGLLQILRDQLENFLKPQRHDVAQMLDIDRFERQAEFVGNGNGLSFAFLIHQRRAVFELELFRAAQGHFQAVSQIVGNMVATNRQHAGVLDDATGINDVIRRAAADVNDQRAEFLLLVGQQRQRRRKAVENNFIHFQLQAFDKANGVLQAVRVAVNDVHIHLQPRTEHPHRIRHAILSIHKKMLADGVNDVVFRRQIDRLRVLDHILHIVLGNFAVGGNHRMHAAIVESANVSAGDTQINIADFHIGHLLGLDDGVAHVLLGLRCVHDLALAHAARTRLAETDDIQRAIGVLFANDGADFGRADFQTDDDG